MVPDAAEALFYAEIGAIGIFGVAAYLAGDLGILASIALTAAIGFGLQYEAERRLTGRS